MHSARRSRRSRERRSSQGVYLRADEARELRAGRARACGDASGRGGRHRARGGADGGEVVQRAPSTTRLGGPLGMSVVLHASLIAAAIFVRPGPPKVLPPRVQGEPHRGAAGRARNR